MPQFETVKKVRELFPPKREGFAGGRACVLLGVDAAHDWGGSMPPSVLPPAQPASRGDADARTMMDEPWKRQDNDSSTNFYYFLTLLVISLLDQVIKLYLEPK